jgi:hypothetical protein
MIDTLEVSQMMKEVLAEFVHVSPNDMPGFLKEPIVKPSRTRGLISRQFKDDLINFLRGKGRHKNSRLGKLWTKS